ncbi:MAG: zinc ribbon domain-containing protein [Clostridia bacterium]|nr:zinc ribbon domain-containing protein [Clostridia bacterium]
MAKHCGNCGAALADGSRFCENCGAKVPEEKPAEQIGRFCSSCGKELPPRSRVLSVLRRETQSPDGKTRSVVLRYSPVGDKPDAAGGPGKNVPGDASRLHAARV